MIGAVHALYTNTKGRREDSLCSESSRRHRPISSVRSETAKVSESAV